MSYKELWLDLETTGVDRSIHGIIQIAAVVFIDGEEVDSFVTYVKPFEDDQIEDEALKVNGVTREQIAEFPEARECFAALTAFLGRFVNQYDTGDKFLICGYNVKFDTDFLREFWRKSNSKYYGSWFYQQPLDVLQTLVLFYHIHGKPQEKYMRLESIIERMGLEVKGDLHDAKVDIDMTRKVYYKLIETMGLR
jgi:DNA polymerase-3 subunit epsilon